VFFLVTALFSLAPIAGLAQEIRVRAAYSAMSGSMAWVWAAKEGGYFDQQGLKVDLIYIGGTAQLFQSCLRVRSTSASVEVRRSSTRTCSGDRSSPLPGL
jgi:hypothetical protein